MSRNKLEALAIGAFLLVPIALSFAAHRRAATECASPPVPESFDVAAIAQEPAPVVEDCTEIDDEGMPAVEREELRGDEGKNEGEDEGEDEGENEIGALMASQSGGGTRMLLAHDGELVLSIDPEASWGRGAIDSSYDGQAFRARRAVAVDRLPESIAQLLGLNVVVHEVGGGRCSAKIAGFSFYAEVWGEIWAPHEWTLQQPPSRTERRAYARDVMEFPGALMAALSGPRACTAGIAWPADAPPPVTYVREILQPKAQAELALRIVPQLAAEPEFALLRREYDEYRSTIRSEATLERTSNFSNYVDKNIVVHSWQAREQHRSLLIVELRDPTVGCGLGFAGRGAWIYEDREEGLRRLPQEIGFDVAVLIDGDHDGSVQWMSAGPGAQEELSLGDGEDVVYQVPDYGCPC
ncbi:MAG TPA: hypothetical protein ENJ18_06875 [Nannocystis exedens]|nr:hypothetical protein [Nannocystis exedens]